MYASCCIMSSQIKLLRNIQRFRLRLVQLIKSVYCDFAL